MLVFFSIAVMLAMAGGLAMSQRHFDVGRLLLVLALGASISMLIEVLG